MTGAAGGPVFVVGAMGSGTTLTRLVLDSHPNLAIAQETGLARLLVANEWVPFWKFGGEWYGRLGLQREDLDVGSGSSTVASSTLRAGAGSDSLG